MAVETPILDVTYKAAATLAAYQFHLVKFSANKTVTVCTATTDVPCGVLQNKPDAADKPAVVRVIGRSKVMAGGTLTVPTLLSTDANGHAIAIAAGTETTQYIVGQAEEVGADGKICTAMVNCASPGRAA